MTIPIQAATARAAKFRLAAYVYLHYAILLELGAYVMWRNDLLAHNWGPPAAWVFGFAPIVAGSVFLGLLRWQNVWFARVIWLIGAGRFPAYIHGAFVVSDTGPLAPSLYLTALVAGVINMWILGRAAWDY
jgi:hypothetical protein